MDTYKTQYRCRHAAGHRLSVDYQGTYDKEYVASHAIGFDKFADYVLGKEDGIPKTPKWASDICGVPVRIIKALAKDWASRTVTIAHGFGGSFIRGSYSHEPARLEVCLLGMQGLGKPGAHQFHMIEGTFLAGLSEHRHIPATHSWRRGRDRRRN